MLSTLETGAGLAVVDWFNTGPAILWYIFAPLAALGSELGIMIALAMIYWSVDERAGRRLFVLVLGSQIVSTTAKLAFSRPRPFTVAPDRIVPISQTEGYGIPSGHTIFGTVSGLWLIDTLRKRWATVAGVVYILAMGVSRMVHGVHYPQDVVFGLILGAAFYAVYRSVELWMRRRKRQALWSAPLSVFVPVVLGGIALLFVATLFLHSDFEQRKSVLSVTGALAGAIFGLSVDERRLAFSADGTIGRRLLRLLVGLPLLAGFHLGLGELYYAVVGEATGVGALSLYVLRYAFVGAIAAVGIPALFRFVGLAAIPRTARPATSRH